MEEGEVRQNLDYKLYGPEEKIKKGIINEPIIGLVDDLLFRAISVGASDIHLEPNQNGMRVRYRIDSVLFDQDSIDFEKQLLVLSRLKVLSGMDIAQKRIPQDGKLRVKVSPKNNLIDMRISTFPSIYGEKMVVRILDRESNCISLNSLGCGLNVLEQLNALIARPYGFFLVTGPTGSGKTTTLYAILSALNNAKRNIVTMEDPVEYNLDGITQSQVNPKAGFDFENGLRSILRQDPDVVMVGEIRDKQTAQIAIEAALTGHLVLSTLHTNDSVGAVTRLLDMGIEPFLINASLSGVLAQRLVRKLCEMCKEKTVLNANEHDILNNKKLKKIFKSKGCSCCFDLGYKGRTGIFELLMVNDNIRDLIMQKASAQVIREQAIKDGLVPLKLDGICKVEDGVVSMEELLRVVE